MLKILKKKQNKTKRPCRFSSILRGNMTFFEAMDLVVYLQIRPFILPPVRRGSKQNNTDTGTGYFNFLPRNETFSYFVGNFISLKGELF